MVSIASGWPNVSSDVWRRSRAPGRDRETSRRALPKRAGVSRKRKPSPPTPSPSSRIGVVVGSSPSPLLVLRPTRPSKAPRRRLQVWDKASNDGENHRNGMRRVAGIQRNMNDFETEARALILRCAPTAADLPAEAAARLLNERLVAARTAQTKRHAAAELREAAGERAMRPGLAWPRPRRQ